MDFLKILRPIIKVEIKVMCICEEFKYVVEFEFDLDYGENLSFT